MSDRPRFNLHNHTLHSDGQAEARQVVEAAAKAGLTHVGITDHLRSTKLPPDKTVSIEQVPAYIDEVRSLRARHHDRPLVLAGLEVNFSLLQTDFTFLSQFELNQAPLNQLDFLLFEYVNDSEYFGLGLEELLKLRPLFSIPIGLAHNDLERNFGGVVKPESLARILGQAHVFVELCPTRRNSRSAVGTHLPFYRVPGEFNRRFFAAAAKEGLLFSVGCDVHADLGEVGAVDDALDFLDQCGLGEQTVAHKLWRPSQS